MRSYAERYWEMFNEIDGGFDEVAVRTFKVGLPSEHWSEEVLDRETGHQLATTNG